MANEAITRKDAFPTGLVPGTKGQPNQKAVQAEESCLNKRTFHSQEKGEKISQDQPDKSRKALDRFNKGSRQK